MRVYCLAYVGAFTLIIVPGFMATLFITFRTTFRNDRMAYDTPLSELELTSDEVPLGQVMQEPESFGIVDAIFEDNKNLATISER